MPTWLLVTVLTVTALWMAGHLWPSPFARLLLAGERLACGMRSRQLRAGGIDWHYLDGGRGEALVLLHGFNADAHHFTRIGRHLTKHLRLLAPDLPGFGESSIPSGTAFDIETQAQRVLAWLDALGLQCFDIGGNSMGGYIAAAIARLAPERVRRLWLLAPGGLYGAPYAEVFQEIEAGRHNPLIVRDQADFERLVDLCFVQRPWVPRVLRRHLGARAAAGTQRAAVIFDAMRYRSPPLETIAPDITAPTLITWGDHDRVLHPHGLEQLRHLVGHARTELLTQTGHLPMLEHPARCARSWLNFCRKADDRA